MIYWPYVIQKWQIWRLFTGFVVVNSQPMQGLMEIYMLYSYSRGIEENKFYNNFADYLFYLAITMPLIVFSSIPFSRFSLLQAFLGLLTYTWSRANKHQKVNIYFLPIKANLLPVVTLGFKLLLEGPTVFCNVMTGMAIAYFYACIETRSLGPLYSYIVDTLGINVITHSNSNRVGTINTINEVQDGYLPAPVWFTKLIQKTIGNTSTGASIKRGNMTTLRGVDVVEPRNRSTASSSGFSFGGSSGVFKGKGQRLGSS